MTGRISNKIINTFNFVMFITVFTVKVFIDILEERGSILPGMDNLRYIVLVIAIFFGLLGIIFNKYREKKYINFKELCMLLFICTIFFIYSTYLSKKLGFNLDSRTYVEIIYLIMPALYSFCIINIYKFQVLEKAMRALFWIYLILYMYSIDIFSISIKAIMATSFSNSYSYFESSIFAFPMLVLFFFFSYYRKNNKYYWITSFILTLLTFKRMILIWAIILFILDNIIEIRFYINKKWKYFLAIVFIIATIIYYGTLTDTGIGNVIMHGVTMDLETKTMGRKWFLSLLLNSNYVSYGYGSSSVALGRCFNMNDIKYLEMDLIKIYLELGIVCLSIFCLYFWKITKDNLFNIIIMLSIFMNLLVSHSLTDPFNWTIIYIIIICVSYNLSEREDASGKKKYTFKFKNNIRPR
ncbi:hypothetical protein [Clostridium butyricum]|uniref:Putative membrane protein n=3 Tax=Clostridium butyricum TaxID=1492 RepID=C4IDA6_CLOBU|nr:hypothetical protein [Clostridium butyricum]APF22559.1 putative membrane protein [Clostridium butyricum]EDT76671.1 putative membrane protein [Clostridium butyricum 5521]EEP55812.1 putative membrane protein [Clostridium butyricum E4 str. BoNT E BL5262]NFS19766.1 hypothetical protein [Clostridium butyricum]